MNVYTESKITIPEERYNELIRAEYSLHLVRRILSDAKQRNEKIGILETVVLDGNGVDALFAITGKGGEA